MDEILFENEYEHTEEYFKEFHNYNYFTLYFKKPIIIFFNIRHIHPIHFFFRISSFSQWKKLDFSEYRG